MRKGDMDPSPSYVLHVHVACEENISRLSNKLPGDLTSLKPPANDTPTRYKCRKSVIMEMHSTDILGALGSAAA